MEIQADVPRVEDPPALVVALEPALGTPERVELAELGGGNANETLRLDWDEEVYVLRIPPTESPAPELLADTDREAAALSAVEDAAVPAPRLHHHCRDASVLGDPFLVTEHVAGEVLEGELPERFDAPAARAAIVEEIVAALADLHAVDPPAAFADDPASPGAYLTAQLSTFRRQLEWAETVTADVRRVDGLHALLDRLEARRPDPDGSATLVHGDFKPDNLLVAPDATPELAGVLDWEMAGRGDPLADLGWLLSYWSHPDDPSFVTAAFEAVYGDHDYFPLVAAFASEYTAFATHPDTPGRGEVVDRYEAVTGRVYEHDRFYRALGALKLGVICEGFFRIFREHPDAAKETYPAMELLPFVLAEQGRATLDGEVPLRS